MPQAARMQEIHHIQAGQMDVQLRNERMYRRNIILKILKHEGRQANQFIRSKYMDLSKATNENIAHETQNHYQRIYLLLYTHSL